jgi:hypothetical protein
LKTFEFLWRNEIFDFAVNIENMLLKDGEVKLSDIFLSKHALIKSKEVWIKNHDRIII